MHGTSAITAITAQNTVGVSAIHRVPPEIVLAQVRAVLCDIGVDAVKVGMLGTAEITLAVAAAIDELPAGTPVVVDPVMVAESGARLLEPDAQLALVQEILPRAGVLTPNLPEARALVGRELAPAADEDVEAEALARAVLALGPRVVVLTGGHRARAVDLFLDSAGAGPAVEHRGPAPPRRRRTRLRLHALGGPRRPAGPRPTRRWTPRAPPAPSPERRLRTGYATSGRAPARSTSWTSPACARVEARTPRPFAIIGGR